MLLLLLLLAKLSAVLATVPLRQVSALCELYHATDGSLTWPHTKGWDTCGAAQASGNYTANTDPCGADWDGVVCDGLNVVGLNVALVGGEFHNETAALCDLYLSTNGPSSWTHKNGWETCRGGIGTATAPVAVCSGVSWHGVTCSSLSGRVQKLELGSNGLAGVLSNSVTDLGAVEVLKLDTNDLSGTIPERLGLTKLVVLWLSNTKLSGTIPPSIGHLSAMKDLTLSETRLSGTIPATLCNLTLLENLRVHSSVGLLEGSLPENIGDLTALKWLFVSGNPGLSGTIPEVSLSVPLSVIRLDTNTTSGAVDRSACQFDRVLLCRYAV